MDLVSLRMITDDPERAAQFYEEVTGMSCRALHARVRRVDHAVLHAGHRAYADRAACSGGTTAEPAANRP